MLNITKQKLREANAFYYPKVSLFTQKDLFEEEEKALKTLNIGILIDDEAVSVQGFNIEADVNKNQEHVIVSLRGGIGALNHLNIDRKRVRDVLSALMQGENISLWSFEETLESEERIPRQLFVDVVSIYPEDLSDDKFTGVLDPSQSEDYLFFVNGKLYDIQSFTFHVPKAYNSIIQCEMSFPVKELENC